MKLEQLVMEQRLLICVGAGGVGKTSVAASIGLRAAIMGRKVLVLTIDPARRLANSLGLSQFGNDETQIDLAPLGEIEGELWAMMLDGRKTFDELINRLSKDAETRDAILSNNIYQGITDTIVGNQEYMATEKLYDVVVSGRYDLVVLDTPPVKNALDFLDSPGRMARFVDRRVMKWFLAPYEEKKVFGKLIAGTSAALFRLLGYIFGKEFLEDISVFFQNFRNLYEGFQQRHMAVEQLFRSGETAFLVICAPHEPAIEVAGFFLSELSRRRMPNPGVVVNQRHLVRFEGIDQDEGLGELAEELEEGLENHTAQRLLARLHSAHRRLCALNVHEARLVRSLETKMSGSQVLWTVPRIQGEVHDIHALNKLGLLLFG
jgi:anion-transporting  ArsA/GET3 family ATPase